MNCGVYLSFDGNCEEAILYYKTIFDGNIQFMMRYSEGPPAYSSPTIENKIMHATLTFGNDCEIKASDSFSMPLHKGNNFHVSILADDEKSASSYFKGLSENGQITMPFDDVFWGGKFGSVIDKFGVQWMISSPDNKHT